MKINLEYLSIEALFCIYTALNKAAEVDRRVLNHWRTRTDCSLHPAAMVALEDQADCATKEADLMVEYMETNHSVGLKRCQDISDGLKGFDELVTNPERADG